MVRLTAPPAEGKANQALLRFLAGVLKAAPSSIEIVRGVSARDKVLRFEGVTAAALRQRLED